MNNEKDFQAFREIVCKFARNKQTLHQMDPNMLGPLLLLSDYIQTKRYKIKCKQAGLFAERSRSHETHFCANLIEGSAEFQQEVVLPNFRPQGCFLPFARSALQLYCCPSL
jgi:hypothetical protein